jgi:choline-sulfatase
MSDQHRADLSGFAGNDVVRTPTLDHLAATGTVFNNAYTTVASGKLHHVGTDQMQGWRTRIAPDAEMSDPYIDEKVVEEFERYTPEPGTGKWSNQRELEEARVVEGPYQRFDSRVLTATMGYIDRYSEEAAYRRPGYYSLLRHDHHH